MFRVWTDLGQPFGECFLPKEMDWQFDELGMPIFIPMPEVSKYWEFNSVSEACDWIDVFYNKRMLQGQWTPPRGSFIVKEVTPEGSGLVLG